MKTEKLSNPYVRGNEGCSVSMIDLLEKINEIIDAMNGEHEPDDIYSEDGRLIAKKDESEDERIRKWLVDYFGSIKETVWIHRDITCGQILSWLEKQKPAEWSEVELEFRGEKVTVKRPFFRDDKGRGYSTTKQDEEVAWNALRAWCEKKGISLYDLYPKAEWSEEDEKMLTDISWAIRHCAYDDKKKERVMKWFNDDYLKSLRPSWKPSEEQMDALQCAIAFMEIRKSDYDISQLKDLYEDLKRF